MITWDEVKQINSKLVLENGGSPEEDSSCEEISSIVYYTDVIECEGTAVIHRHIDIEYSFGDYYEVCEDMPLFEYICTLCSLPKPEEEQELILYQNESFGG